jgi:hypothetical protein
MMLPDDFRFGSTIMIRPEDKRGEMPLENRVDPFGRLHAVAARGTMTGNRGVLHHAASRSLTGRRWTTKAWIACVCDFRGRRRDVMGFNGHDGRPGWTELFFLDEVTALAAGHRPCFFCRRADAKRFAAAFPGAPLPAPAMDAVLHGERLASTGARGEPVADVSRLPDGAMVADGARAFAIRKGRPVAWSFEGYGETAAGERHLRLVTPPSIVAALAAGYEPRWHPSVDARAQGP